MKGLPVYSSGFCSPPSCLRGCEKIGALRKTGKGGEKEEEATKPEQKRATKSQCRVPCIQEVNSFSVASQWNEAVASSMPQVRKLRPSNNATIVFRGPGSRVGGLTAG
ncbi:hypothetical protein KM043_015518 [Ampulex compressa]|nr:hypothetical protein KM043_015518 [Ampulex compressa]